VEDVGKVFGHDPGHEVHRAASGKGDDDPHDFFGVGGAGGILCSRYWRGEKKNRQKCASIRRIIKPRDKITSRRAAGAIRLPLSLPLPCSFTAH
jgi:hypothetical protein